MHSSRLRHHSEALSEGDTEEGESLGSMAKVEGQKHEARDTVKASEKGRKKRTGLRSCDGPSK